MPCTSQARTSYVLPKAVISARNQADRVFNDKVEIIGIHQWEDRTIPGPGGPLPLRIYTPGTRTDYPVLLYFHGGGFVIHNIASHDSLCRKLAITFDCIVISVGYRLSPEFPYPAALEDAYAALKWTSEQALSLGGDPARVMVGGDSAGATLSAALSILVRDNKGPAIDAQLLFYGAFGCLEDDENPSLQQFAKEDHILTMESINWFGSMYTRGCDPMVRYVPTCYPGTASDLSNLPKTLVITAELDPLRDDGEEFAHRMEQAGNKTILCRMADMYHGFLLSWDKHESVRRNIDEIAALVRELV